jgi:hypothetical protein
MTEQSVEVIQFKSHLRIVLNKHGFEGIDETEVPDEVYLAAKAETLRDLGMTQVPKSEDE